MRVHYLQHVPYEGLAWIEHWVNARNYPISVTRFYQDEALPALSSLDSLIVMGGLMGANDETEYPWLTREKQYIESAMQAGKIVIGICLGAQLIASVLGARVYRNEYAEIGWFPVRFSETVRSQEYFPFLPPELTVFHWHEDTFDLPAGAVPLGASVGCPTQGFLYGDRILGLQFHLESTPESVRELIVNSRNELAPGKYMQPPEAILSAESTFRPGNRIMAAMLDTILQKKGIRTAPANEK